MYGIDKSLLWFLSADFRPRPPVFKARAHLDQTPMRVQPWYILWFSNLKCPLISDQGGRGGELLIRLLHSCLFVALFVSGSVSNLALLISSPGPPLVAPLKFFRLSLSHFFNSTKSFPGDCNGLRMKGRSGCEAAEICKCRINTPIGFAHSH